MKKILKSIGVSLSLTTLFFYPLIMSLFNEGQYYFHWSIINTIEFIGSFIILFLIFLLFILITENFKQKLLRSFLIIIIACIPFAFFSIHIVRQFVNKSLILSFANFLFTFYGWIFLGLLTIILLFTQKIWFNKFYEKTISIIMIFFPLFLLPILFLFLYGFNSQVDKIGNIEVMFAENVSKQKRNNIYILLFDELDYSVLYGLNKKIKNKYINFKKLSDLSSNYHNARAPGSGTLKSVPQLLIGKRHDKIFVCGNSLCSKDGDIKSLLNTQENIFNFAKKLNFRTASIAWMHKYCQQYEKNLDYCRSFGVYNNYSSFESNFSLLNPIYSNIIMLPYQMPFGLFKNPIYSNFHHKNTKEIHRLNLNLIEKNISNDVLSFVHYPIPHSPYIYKNNVYKPDKRPFIQNLKKYEDQLLYVDKLLGEVIDKIVQTNQLNRSTIVLISDHGFREVLPDEKWDHVPMIIFRGDNPINEDIMEEVQTEKILFSLLENFENSEQR